MKKSRFLASALPLTDDADLERCLNDLRHDDASHNCWAWRIGEQCRSSDDGEPGGTAGRPILAAIDGAGLDHVLVVVARWFGGIKLGAGGLVRAYGGAAAECLRQAPQREVQARGSLRVLGSVALLGIVYALAERHAARVIEEHHQANGACWLLDVPLTARQALLDALTDASRGQLRIADDGS